MFGGFGGVLGWFGFGGVSLVQCFVDFRIGLIWLGLLNLWRC